MHLGSKSYVSPKARLRSWCGAHEEWGDAMRSGTRVRISLLVLVLGLGMVLSACIVESETRFCACPKLEALAPTIDWSGTGELAETVDSTVGFDGFRHRVALLYESSDAIGDLAVAVERLTDAGFHRSDDSDHSFRGDEWLVLLKASGTAEQPLVVIFVEIAEDDRANEILQPFIDAFGTVP